MVGLVCHSLDLVWCGWACGRVELYSTDWDLALIGQNFTRTQQEVVNNVVLNYLKTIGRAREFHSKVAADRIATSHFEVILSSELGLKSINKVGHSRHEQIINMDEAMGRLITEPFCARVEARNHAGWFGNRGLSSSCVEGHAIGGHFNEHHIAPW